MFEKKYCGYKKLNSQIIDQMDSANHPFDHRAHGRLSQQSTNRHYVNLALEQILDRILISANDGGMYCVIVHQYKAATPAFRVGQYSNTYNR